MDDVEKVALERLESANERVCRLRSDEAYQAMLRCPGMQDALLELDQARAAARAALSALSTQGEDVEKVAEERAKIIANSLAVQENWGIGSNMWNAARLGAFRAMTGPAALSAHGGCDDVITDEMKAAGRHAVGMVFDAGSFEIMAVEAYKAMRALRTTQKGGWNEAIEAAKKAMCRHCRLDMPLHDGEDQYQGMHRIERHGVITYRECDARPIRALRRPATGEG